MREFDYSIRSGWSPRQESPASLGAKFLNSIDALSRIDPTIFTNWQVMDFPAIDSFPLAEARPRIAAIIENNVARDDLKVPQPGWGYTASAYTDNANEPRNADLKVKTGGLRAGELFFQAGRYKVPAAPAMLNYSLFRSVLLSLDAIWPPTWACARAFALNYGKVPLHPGAPLFPYSLYHIPWIAYLSPRLVTHLSIPANILTETTPDGGLLMTTTEDRLDPTNPEHLRRARILADILIERTGYSSQ
jgi:hypothetical protein